MEMPTPCYNCKGWFELNDLRMCFTCDDGRSVRCDGCDAEHQDEMHQTPEAALAERIRHPKPGSTAERLAETASLYEFLKRGI